MKTNVPANPINSLSSVDFVDQFIANFGSDIRYRSYDIQTYDYKQLSGFLKLPTSVFRIEYNFVLLLEGGNVLMQFGTETRRICAPATLFVSAGQINSVQEISEDVSGSIVILENDSLIRIFSKQDLLKILKITNVISLSQEDTIIANGIGKLLLKEFQSEKPVQSVMTALVQALLHKILKHSDINDALARNM